MTDTYVQVHQVWNYVTYKQKQEQLQFTSETESSKTPDKTRHIIQVTRIKKKYDIYTLAKMAGTTPKALSLFEKGEDILSKEVLETLFKVLEIPTKRV